MSAWWLFTLPCMLGLYYWLPRYAAKQNAKEFKQDQTDRFGNLWHKQRGRIRASVLVAGALVGHLYFLHDATAYMEGVLLGVLAGSAYFGYVFTRTLNIIRSAYDKWVTEWYVSRSATTSWTDTFLCTLADMLGIDTQIVLRRFLLRTMALFGALYAGFWLVEVSKFFH